MLVKVINESKLPNEYGKYLFNIIETIYDSDKVQNIIQNIFEGILIKVLNGKIG